MNGRAKKAPPKKAAKNEIIELSGAITVFGDMVNTDVIHNPQGFTIDQKRLKPSAFSSSGGPAVILAGRNFGIGSSRYSTVVALKNSGVVAVAAISLSRIFERNLAAAGIYPVTICDMDDGAGFARYSGDNAVISVHSEAGGRAGSGNGPSRASVSIKIGSGGRKVSIAGTIPRFLLDIVLCGGMVGFLAKES